MGLGAVLVSGQAFADEELVPQPRTAAQMSGVELHTQQVVDHHFVAFDEGDLDGVASDYGNNSVLIAPEGVFVGTTEIRGYYAVLLAEFGHSCFSETFDPGCDSIYSVPIYYLKGNTVYFTWNSTSINCVWPFLTDTIVVTGNKISLHTIANSAPSDNGSNSCPFYVRLAL